MEHAPAKPWVRVRVMSRVMVRVIVRVMARVMVRVRAAAAWVHPHGMILKIDHGAV